MDLVNLEIKEDEEYVKEGKYVDVNEWKIYCVQLVFSIYELGVSYMNGWGIEQDKVLVLKCFEIVGGMIFFYYNDLVFGVDRYLCSLGRC